MTDDVQVDGLDELKRRLKKLSSEVTNTRTGGPLGQALFAGAKVVMDDAKSRVPVDSGELQRSITRRRVKDPKIAMKEVAIGIRNPRDKAPYGLMVELGTSKMSAQPFLRPALESPGVRRTATEKVATVLRKKIEKAEKL